MVRRESPSSKNHNLTEVGTPASAPWSRRLVVDPKGRFLSGRISTGFKKVGHSDPCQKWPRSLVTTEISLRPRAQRQPSASKGGRSIPTGITLGAAQSSLPSVRIQSCRLLQTDSSHSPTAGLASRRGGLGHILEPGLDCPSGR